MSGETIQFQDFDPGCTPGNRSTVFRLFAPEASFVELLLFNRCEDENGTSYSMEKDESGFWNCEIGQNLKGKWYAYRLQPKQNADSRGFSEHLIADPWSKHVCSKNHHLHFHKSYIPHSAHFNWENDSFVCPADPRDLVIYETHIKDMVAHPSARTNVKGIYNDFREAVTGGINHLKEMGVNAVEFLPLQKFGYFEPPFKTDTEEGIRNTWNAYSRNYWGYMTSFYMAPETIYASDSSLEYGHYTGTQDCARNELRELVKALHKEKITVLMDVVYNHASHYDLNPLKYTAREHYFRLDEAGNFRNDSWTGNDIDTSTEWSRKLIVESVKYWMKEYHIDGFRFDLAGIIDWETIDMIREEARKINPDVLLIAEPWGGEYKPKGFSHHGWSSWNDVFRNAFKGYDPGSDKGYVFGNINSHLNRYALENFIRGTLESGPHGLFSTSAHSVNYLESHDGYTLGDFIRIVLDPEKKEQVFENRAIATRLNEEEKKHAYFAAACLFFTQGITMMHAGQEWARSKIIDAAGTDDPDAGKIDRDTYNKDNRTNWLDFTEKELNRGLYEYYRGLIALRLKSPALRKALPQDIDFKVYNDPLHITFSIDGENSGDRYDYFLSLNANPVHSHEIILPEGYWEEVVNDAVAGDKTIQTVTESCVLPPLSARALRKLRVKKA